MAHFSPRSRHPAFIGPKRPESFVGLLVAPAPREGSPGRGMKHACTKTTARR